MRRACDLSRVGGRETGPHYSMPARLESMIAAGFQAGGSIAKARCTGTWLCCQMFCLMALAVVAPGPSSGGVFLGMRFDFRAWRCQNAEDVLVQRDFRRDGRLQNAAHDI